MHHWVRSVILVAVMIAAGCVSNRRASPPTGAGDSAANPEGIRYPLVRPVLLMPGTVVSVLERLRFAVIDFGIHPLPASGTVLEVRRDGVAVGKLRVSGPDSGSQTIADLIEGETAPGDEAHPLPDGG